MASTPRKLSPSEEMRMLAGTVAQPFLVGVVGFFLFPVILLDRSGRTLTGGFPVEATEAAVSVGIWAGLMALLVTVVGALPAAVWLTKRKQVSLGEALLCGLAFGGAPTFIGAILAGGPGAAGLVRALTFSMLLGATGAAGFWAIAIRRRRDAAAVP